MDKKGADTKPKPGVKFADSRPSTNQDDEARQADNIRKNSVILDPEECKKRVLEIFNDTNTQFKRCTKNDSEVKRKDTARALTKILDKLRRALNLLNQQDSDFKEKNYYLTYNGTIYIFEVCRALRKSVYSSLTLPYLAACILSMETSLNLMGVKFLDWRIKLYIEIAHIYDQSEAYKASTKTIDTAIQKVNELREIEENDPPVPDHVANIIENNLRILRALEIKYKLHTGALNADGWKKKVEEYFKKDIDGRNLAIIESLNLNYKKHSNIVNHAGTAFPWKEQVLNFSYDMVKDDIATLAKALSQLDERLAMSLKLRENADLEQAARSELSAKIREFGDNMVLEKVWKRASQNVPIELHIELLKNAYDLNSKVYYDLLQTALVRCYHRRVEVPYIVDIQLEEAPTPHTNIPNDYEEVPIDINEAHLKAELAQLRISIVKEIARQQEEKRQEKIADMKTGKNRAKQGDTEVPRERPPDPSTIDVDPANVKHNYMHFLVKRSYSPENAIYAIDVVMANEDEGPVDLKAQGWRTIKISIDQYTGVRETTRMVPFLCLKHSRNGLQDEEEKKHLVVDFLPILGKSYLVRPKFGFEKLFVDLRQVPQQFYKLPNLDFVYLSYKADKMFYICEKEVYILKALDELEKTHRGNKTTNEDEEIKANLDVNYDLNKLRELASVIKQSLEGPLGDYFYEARKDFLIKFAFYMWKKYLVSSLHQIDTAYELRITDEIQSEEFTKYEILLGTMKDSFIEILEAINQIMMRTEVFDVVWTAKLNIELCKLLEEKGDFRKAAQLLRFANNKIIEFKDQLFSRGVESKKDVFLPLTITCDNLKIHHMIEEMKNKYYDWKTWLRKEIRSKRREKGSEKSLDQDEAQEEDYEFREISHFYGRDDLKDGQYLDSLNFNKAFIEYYGIVNSLHTDVVADLIRCEIKAGKYSQKIGLLKSTDKLTLTLKNPVGLEKLPERLKAKMSLMGAKTAKQIHKNATLLQTTLQNAGKIEPPKPKVKNYESELIQEGNNNSYFNALLHMTMATNKSKQPEQKYLLKEAFKYIKQAEEEERLHISNGVQNAVFLFSTLLDDENTEKNSNNFYPFNYLYSSEYIQPKEEPSKPVLISRSTNSITLKLPPFEPIIPENLLLANPSLKTVTSMALFGKVSQHGVTVSTTSNDLQNTGTRVRSGAIVTVSKLRMNEKYCFAAAAYDPREKVINNQIGNTGEDIATVLPLPLNLLYAYLALTAYQLDDFELSEEAAERAGRYFCEETDIKERSLDYNDNPIYMYRIRSETAKNYSINEIRVAAINYIVLARCLQKRFTRQEAQTKSMPYIVKQKNTLVVCNYLLLALELCSITKSYVVAKRIVKELYNDVLPFFAYKTKTKFIFHVLLRVQLLISQIPKEVWDSNLRACSIKVTYELLKMTLQFNETKLSKLFLYYDSKLPHKKWFIVSKTIMVDEAVLQEAKDKDDKKKDPKKDAKKGKGKPPSREAGDRPETAEQPKLVPKLVREIAEKLTLQDNLEEFLLSLGEEYYDSVMNFIEFWKEQLETFKPYIDNGAEIIEQKKSELSLKFDFWDLVRDHTQAFAKIQLNYKGTPYYMEFVSKYLKKAFEKRAEAKDLVEQMKQVAETDNPAIQAINQIRDLKLKAIEGDIGWNPSLLEELVAEKEINKVGEDLAIDLYAQYWKYYKELQEKGMQDKQFYYNMKWLAEFNLLRGTLHYIQLFGNLKEEIENRFEVFFDIKEMDLESLNQTQEEGDADSSFITIDQARITELIQIMKYLCNATMYGLAANLGYLLQNIAKIVFNIFKVEMITPFDHKGTELYKYIVLLSQNLVAMLELNKESVKLTQGDNTNFFELSLSRQAWTQIQDKKAKEGANSKQFLLDTALTKEFWFSKENYDISTIANITAYCLQTLTVENKLRVLVEDSKHLCNMTQHYFSLEVLPFTVFAQKNLHEQARDQTNAKIAQLDARTKAYEEWKSTNKRRMTRQAMLTGEIPPEQIEYEKDAEELNRQIRIYKAKEDFLNNEKSRSEDVLFQIKRDVNQVLEGLNQTRRLLARYGQGMKEAEVEEKSAQPDEKIGKRNRVLSQILITKYMMTIDQLKKKQENTALIHSLHELGNLNFSIENIIAAVDNWNDSLDTMFQKFESLKAFREIISNYKTLGYQLGVQKCVIGGVLLYKLSNFCYSNNLHLQRECQLMAFDMLFAIFKSSLPHHFVAIDFGIYRVKEIVDKEEIFSNKYVLSPADTIIACNYHALYLMDMEKHVNALPIVGLLEYLATNVTMSAYYCVKAKILKAICLCALGYINEAYTLLIKISKEKDLPTGFFRSSEFSRREYGYNFASDEVPYLNQYSPYDERNTAAIESIMKLEINGNFKFKYGFINHNLFYFAKAALIFTIYDVENYEKVDLNDRRFNKLAEAESILRSTLKRLAFEETLNTLVEEYNSQEAKLPEEEPATKTKLADIKTGVIEYLSSQGIETAEQELHFKHKEASLRYSEAREERISWTMRIRHLLSSINNAMNFTTRSYYILKQAIINLKLYAEDQKDVEKGEEAGNTPLEFKGGDEKGGKPDQKIKKEAKKETKDVKKDTKKDSKKPGQGGPDEEKKQADLEKKKIEEEMASLRHQAEERKGRNIFNSFWWIKLRTDFCNILCKQNKLEECLALIDLFKKDCTDLKDTFFIRSLNEIEAKVLLKQGKIDESLDKYQKVIQQGKSYHHDDVGYGRILGDYADILFQRGKTEEAETYYRAARAVFTNLLHEVRYEFYPQNINKQALNEDIKIAEVLQLPIDVEANILKSDKFKSKKDEKKGAKDDKAKKPDPKGKGKVETADKVEEMSINPLSPLPEYDFTKDNKHSFTGVDEKQVSSQLPFIYSLKNYEYYVKATLNQVRCNLYRGDMMWDQSMVVKSLDDVNTIIQNIYQTPISSKYLFNFLYGKAFRRKFMEDLLKIHKEYEEKYTKQRIKKYKKLKNRVPHRDLLRNVYMIEIPGFSETLKETLLPYLDKSKEYLKKSADLLKSECLLFENGIKVEEVFTELCQVCLYMREYRPRPNFKYYQAQDLEGIAREKSIDEITDYSKHLEELIERDKKQCDDLEWEAFSYLSYSIQASNAKVQLQDNFATIGLSMLLVPEKIPTDIYNMIIESDYQQKKTYESKLFDDSKRKTIVSSIDVLVFLNRLSRESSILSFSGINNQKIISRLHRYTSVHLSTYVHKCIMQKTDVQLRPDLKASPLSEGMIIVKLTQNPRTKEHKMIYMLGPLNKDKIQSSVSAEEVNRIIINQENEVLYGTLYFEDLELSKLLQEAFDLKNRMEASDKRSEEAKERDYKHHRFDFETLITKFGMKFKDRNSSADKDQSKSSIGSAAEGELDPAEFLDKYQVLVPDLTKDNINLLIGLFDGIGLAATNFNYLALIRHFHKMKYR